MHSSHRRLVLLFAVALAAGLTVGHEGRSQSGSSFEHAQGRHGEGHAELHHLYRNWHPPTNPAMSCCNDSDCRPTRAKQDESGNWLAWNGSKWLPVPRRALLPSDIAGDGRSHICEKNDFVYCFTPADPKM